MRVIPSTHATFLAVCLVCAPAPAHANPQDATPPESSSQSDAPRTTPDFPRLEPIRELAEGGEWEQARALLRDLIGKEGQPIASLVDKDTSVDWLKAVAALASELSDTEAEGQAREELHGVLVGLLPAEHPDLLAAKASLAVTRYELGDLQGAHELFEHVHAARERLLPFDHPDLLAAKQQLAATRRARGDLTGAHELFENVHAARERLLPSDHPDLLTAKQNLAVARKDLGDLPGALELEEHVHAARERLLPGDHPDLLGVKQNLATTRYQLGDLIGALELQEHVHTAWERLLPSDHAKLLRVRVNLALTRRALGDLPGALELQEHVHAARERLFPSDHPKLLTAKLNLAVTRKELGDLSGALELEERVHAAWERLLPLDHPNLLTAKGNLAVTRRALGDLAGALELHEHVHTTREYMLPADHPDLLLVKGNLAVARSALGDLTGAHELFEHVHATRERFLPADHPDLLVDKQNLAASHAELGNLPGALELQEQVHAAWERLLPSDHPDLLDAKHNLAATRYLLGDLSGALELEEHVHAVRERLLPADHPYLLLAKGNLAGTRAALGDLKGAENLVTEIAGASTLQLRRQSTLSRRQARDLAALVSRRVARSRASIANSGGGENATDDIFGCLELGRSIISDERARGNSGNQQADPETARLTAALQGAMGAIDSHVASPPESDAFGVDADEEPRQAAAEAAMNAWSRELARLSLVREASERELFAHLGEQGRAILDLTPEAIAAALAPSERAVGIHKLPCWRLEPVVDPPGGSLQEYKEVADGDHYIAYLVDHGGSPVEVDLGSAEAIDKAVLAWRGALGSPLEGRGGLRPREKTGEEELSAGRALRSLLVDPLSAGLEPGATLYICSDDALHALPVDALPLDAAEGAVDRAPARLGDLYTVHPELSFERLLRAARETGETASVTEDSLLIVGDVRYDEASSGEETLDTDALDARILAQAAEDRASAWGEWSALPGTKSEAIAIDAVARRALGIEPETLDPLSVTRKALSNAAAGKRYVHIATHGWFMPETVRSMFDTDDSQSRNRLLGTEDTVSGFAPLSLCGLVMSGANTAETPAELSARLLTAMELSAFDLSGCELAVLSACETNVGVSRAGQGIQSLRTALHQAGARTSVTSLWRVDDAATRDLMVAFYENLLEKGMGKAEALWAAKGMLRARNEPVRNWAGWVLTGDPD